ncbi:MAG TPA: HEAT repeat domain-containing protein [Thermoanaerobaculia bacterium]
MTTLLLALTLLASPAQIENALGSTSSGWIGYSVPLVDTRARICCWDCSAGGCALESSNGFSVNRGDSASPAAAPRKLLVFARLRDRTVESIRVFSSDCTVDTAGANVRWLGDLATEESVAFLTRVAERSAADHASKHAMGALAFHAGDGALRELIRIAKSDDESKKRAHALFWLAQAAGRKAVGTLSDAVENDPDTDVKTKAVFAISLLPRDESVPLLIKIARTHRNAAVRKKAFFWLGQTNDPRAVAFIEDTLLR